MSIILRHFIRTDTGRIRDKGIRGYGDNRINEQESRMDSRII